MPREDWQGILDAVRYGTERSELLRSDEVASEIGTMSALTDGLIDGSAEHYKNSRLTSVRNYSFSNHEGIKSLVLPNVTRISPYAFRMCVSLERADFSSLTFMGTYAFFRDSSLKTLIIRTNEVCVLEHTVAFSNTPIANGEGYLYVPAALVDEYKQATNWTTFADNIRAIEDYPEITGETI
jgi:hypothetical protein